VNSIDTHSRLLTGVDADGAASLIAAASDIALIIDSDGTVCDVSLGTEELSSEGYRKWIGQLWADTVTIESRPKIEALRNDAAARAPRRWRHVNHPSSSGTDIPILYSAVKLGNSGPLVAFGRDLRAIGALQQRLVEAQQSMERDYWRLRHAETRYRVLFQMASEAVLVVDAASNKILEANPAALQLLGDAPKRLLGRNLLEGFDEASVQSLAALLAAARASVKVEDARVRLSHDVLREFTACASLVRQEGASLYLVRLAPVAARDVGAASEGSMLMRVIENAPDGFVVTDADGRVLLVNRAFADLAQLNSEELANGKPLERWLGRPGVDMNILITNLRQHGSVSLYASTLRGEHGMSAEVEISAVSVPQGVQPCLGFSIRNIGQRLRANADSESALPRSVKQLTELVGRVSLKDLVRESTDLIEKLCIEAALELTRDNRASAAEMLGLSRQSLYVKLRRYGLGDLGADSDL
jgi:transcriptional regulator PpsR